MKGIAKFQEKISYFSGKKIVFLPIFTISCAITTLLILLYFDFSFSHFLIPIISVSIMEIIAISLVYQMWRLRDRLKEKYPKTGYQRIFLVGFGGVTMKMFLSFHNIILFHYIGMHRDLNESILTWSQPFTNFLSISSEMIIIINILRYIIGFVIIFVGLLMVFRALKTFGIDYMAVLYLYYPEESTVQNREIYSILRHPAYAALIYISFGGFILQFSLYSLIFFIIYLIGFLIFIFKVEEKELIQRFGDGFLDYKKKTQAILIKPNKFPAFLRFLIGKEKE